MNKELNEMIKPMLGPSLGQHLTVRKLVLTFSFDGPEWAAQAINLKSHLINTVRKYAELPIDDIEIEVRRTA